MPPRLQPACHVCPWAAPRTAPSPSPVVDPTSPQRAPPSRLRLQDGRRPPGSPVRQPARPSKTPGRTSGGSTGSISQPASAPSQSRRRLPLRVPSTGTSSRKQPILPSRCTADNRRDRFPDRRFSWPDSPPGSMPPRAASRPQVGPSVSRRHPGPIHTAVVRRRFPALLCGQKPACGQQTVHRLEPSRCPTSRCPPRNPPATPVAPRVPATQPGHDRVPFHSRGRGQRPLTKPQLPVAPGTAAPRRRQSL